MKISERNLKKFISIYNFCYLFENYQKFEISKNLAKHGKISYEHAQVFAQLMNNLVPQVKCNPNDWIVEEEELNNNAIDDYLILKESLDNVKKVIGAKQKNILFKAVKYFYRKKTFFFQMDAYYLRIIMAFCDYLNGDISLNSFLKNHYFEISLFNGKKSKIDLRQLIRISNYILDCIKKYEK